MSAKKYYEDYAIGDKFVTPPKRITGEEITLFSILALQAEPVDNTRNVHMNSEFAKKYGFKDRVAPGVQTLSYALGWLSTSTKVMKETILLGIDKVRFLAPVYPDDSITVESEVIEKRDSKKYPDKGIIRIRNIAKNQDGVAVLEVEAVYMVNKRRSES